FLAHWDLDEGSGQTAADSSGNGYDMTLGTTSGVDSGDPSWACVSGGYALDFDGSDDEVQRSNQIIGDRAAWSISAWIKMGADTLDQRTIYSEGHSTTGEYLFLYVDDVNNYVKFYSEDADPPYDWAQIEGSTNVEDNVWHHVAMVQRSKTDRQLYVDAVSEGTDIRDAGTYVFDSSAIGILRYQWVVDPFLGMIDNVRIYDYALSPAEIS
ncbi:MAG: hypothetical protein GTO18_13810, partial [Anaerolineales bacterium]|nr:hypothetical protein [Anaerolineales bacterium]